jgi:hypothetical protein
MPHTHNVVIGSERVAKTYTSWDRGQHQREWAALQHLRRYAPGLAPEPISADLDAVPPTLVMTRVSAVGTVVAGTSRHWAGFGVCGRLPS